MKKLSLFIKYPPTIIAAALILSLNLGYFLYFTPGLTYALIMIGLDLALGVAWFLICVKSKTFAAHASRMPYEAGARDLGELLGECSAGFRSIALECSTLVEKVRKDFATGGFEEELGLFVSRLKELAGENARLLRLSRSYGTQEQQRRMAALVKGQEEAIAGQLESLRAFSGNLSLIEAGSASDEAADEASESLKYINQGMEELLKESQRGP